MFKSDISTWVCGIIIASIVIGLIMVLMGKGSATRESFASKSASKASSSGGAPTCGEGEYAFCTAKSGSNTACGCLKNQGGYDEKYAFEGKIACGLDGAYVCNYVKRADGDVKIGCGCLEMLEVDDPRVILSDKFIK